MGNLELQLQKALKENEHLQDENNRLKQLLKHHNIIPTLENKQNDTSKIQSREKKIRSRIELFRDLFKGREDVFAVRWKSKKGKSGYSPAYECKKPTIKCANCPNKKFTSITDQVIYDHLSGKKSIGLYPMLKDGTCYFLAVDFDKKNWKNDATAFIDVCKELDVPASIEISRSGDGCHVWIFFQDAIPAKLARKLGNLLLKRTLEKRYQTGIDSYDRLFPSQDSLPKGGFGNLIALPLQHEPRKNGNSIFVDENFIAYRDQWLYLSEIKKMDKANVEKVIKSYYHMDTSPDVINEYISKQERIPTKLSVICKDSIYIPKEGLPSHFINKIIQLATFNNPAYFKAQAKRLPTYKIPRLIDCSEDQQEHLILPRGLMEELSKLLKENSIELKVEDQTFSGTEISVNFHGQLRTQQVDATEKLLKSPIGILSATTGFGKTVVAASLISKRNVNTLVIVHRKQLMDQWKERLAAFFNIEPSKIGQVGGGKNNAQGNIDIATIQSLNHKGVVKELITKYGQIIVDECHHISAYSFEKVLKKAEATYVHGLTATPTRKDGLHPIMTMQCGPIRFKVNAKEQAKIRPFDHILIGRNTTFKSTVNEEQKNIQNLYAELINDNQRNDMIFNDVLKELDEGSFPIILTERIEHVKLLEAKFKGFAKNIIVLTGGMGKKEGQYKLKRLEELSDDQERLIIATGKYIGEGFDNARLDTMFLVMPISWKGTLQQYVGRLHRLHDKKREVKVYDYVDHKEALFQSMFEKRKKGYKALGYIMEKVGYEGNNQQMKLF
ncbi:DEAD/DEAH box helicase family protein [Virgibacillus byunsanensis]|uniref:DEAD/DEAH box helicase family protein n=1 Tax=Virgibacillus byunsanensis TaxID=570945 RepID=A0ABW3LG55_9BACI